MFGIIIMNDKVKNILIYTGIAGAIISAIAYIVITYTLIVGFETAVAIEKQILFAILGSAVGLMITFFLKNQGITFAEKEKDSIETMSQYHKLINKTKKQKKLHTIKHFMIISTIKDIFFKGLTVAGSTFMIMYIFMEGNGDWSLFRLAISNIFMFSGFGLVALSKAYDHYIDQHIPVIKELIKRMKSDDDDLPEAKERKIDQARSVALKEKDEDGNIQQREISNTSTASEPKQINHSDN